jgi:hypothetical protein
MSPRSAQYRQQQHDITARAELCTPDIARLWREIAASYRFLAEREERLESDQRYAALTDAVSIESRKRLE